MQVEQVQRWVMTILLLTTAVHFAVGLCLLASIASAPGADQGLVIIAAIVGILGVAGSRAIHRVSIWTPWLLTGLIPAIAGAWLVSTF